MGNFLLDSLYIIKDLEESYKPKIKLKDCILIEEQGFLHKVKNYANGLKTNKAGYPVIPGVGKLHH